MTVTLPAQYAWLSKEPGPAILLEALKEFGTAEVPGLKHNLKILNWADEVGGWVGSYYNNDEIPWCGLFIGICAQRAGFPFDQKLLSAQQWLRWGKPVTTAMLGDVLVFTRAGGGHVGLYCGETPTAYLVLGGNQGNKVSLVWIAKSRLTGIRRCKWKTRQPPNVRRVHLKASGQLSQNEA